MPVITFPYVNKKLTSSLVPCEIFSITLDSGQWIRFGSLVSCSPPWII